VAIFLRDFEDSPPAKAARVGACVGTNPRRSRTNPRVSEQIRALSGKIRALSEQIRALPEQIRATTF
jgi:hypothetical protein